MSLARPGYREVMTDDKHTDPKTTDVGTAPEGADADVQSDPASGGNTSEWTDEGGATAEGPATDTE